MKKSPGLEESRGITHADIQSAQGERLKCRIPKSIDPFKGRKCQVVSRLDGKLYRSRREGSPPSERICQCFDFMAKRAFQKPFRFR